MKRYLIILSAIVSAIYLLNPTAGFFELIPDNLPIVGNLDEGAAAYVLFSAITFLMGKNIGLFNRKETTSENVNGPDQALDR